MLRRQEPFSPIRCVDPDVFITEVGVGRLEGEACERVFNNANGSKLSELSWPLYHVTMLNGSASLRVVEWFTLRASGSIVLSGDTVMD